MTNRFWQALILSGIFVFSACDKDDSPANEPDETVPRYLLRAIDWNNGLKARFNYSDSALTDINFTFQNTSGKTVYKWAGTKMIELYDEESLYKNVYHYSNDGKLSFIANTVKSGTMSSSYTLEFSYKSGKVDSLKYFRINEAGKHLETSTSYHYNGSGELFKAITVAGNNSITHNIDNWSPVVSFNPLNYIESTLDENYTIYNYAVMNQSDKLPAKITRSFKIGNTEEEVDKIEENEYTLTGFRIDKVVTAISYPDMPGSNKTIEAVYTY